MKKDFFMKLKGLVFMVKKSKKEEKLCLFFASDYHFEMISLPYINENLKKDNNVVVMTENDLNGTVDKVLSRVNIAKEEKDKITKIDWDCDDVSKFKEIKNANENGKETVIFVKGNENYIKSVNENIKNWMNNGDLKVIDCYDINEVYEDVSCIAKNYSKVLSTSGVEKLL